MAVISVETGPFTSRTTSHMCSGQQVHRPFQNKELNMSDSNTSTQPEMKKTQALVQMSKAEIDLMQKLRDDVLFKAIPIGVISSAAMMWISRRTVPSRLAQGLGAAATAVVATAATAAYSASNFINESVANLPDNSPLKLKVMAVYVSITHSRSSDDFRLLFV